MLGDKKRIKVYLLAAAAVLVVAVIGMALAVRHHHSMRTALLALQEANQADTVFKSDSAALSLVRHFDSPACLLGTSNDRMLAHYLLGRAHADMGEAPAAIQDYYDAIECADTTDADCNIRILRNVYGQMAEVYEAQDLPENEMEAQKRFNHYSWAIADTLQAIEGLRRLERSYFLMGQFDSVLSVCWDARNRLLKYGYNETAARALITPIYIYIMRGDFEAAEKHLAIVRTEAGIFDEKGILQPGREMFYYTLGLYFEGVNQLDSAEYYYRQALTFNKSEAGYKGLLSVYSRYGIADSITKFAALYADANDAYHDSLRTEDVHKTKSLYNYNRHLRIAKEEQTKSQRRLWAFYFAVVIILWLIIGGYYRHSKHLEKERKREHALNTMQQKYIKTLKDYERLAQDVEYRHSYTEQLSLKIHELQEQKEQLEMLTKSLLEKNDIGSYYSHDLVQKIQSQAIYREKTPSAKDFTQLLQLFSVAFPDFITFVSGTHDLTEYEWLVCALTDLGLGNNDMAFLLNQTSQRINNIKHQVNHNLFGDESSATLQANLRAAIHRV